MLTAPHSANLRDTANRLKEKACGLILASNDTQVSRDIYGLNEDFYSNLDTRSEIVAIGRALIDNIEDTDIFNEH